MTFKFDVLKMQNKSFKNNFSPQRRDLHWEYYVCHKCMCVVFCKLLIHLKMYFELQKSLQK